MKEFIINLNKDDEQSYDRAPNFQRITTLRTVKNMFTGDIWFKILVEDQNGCVDERWVTEIEFDDLKKKATYDMQAKMY